MDEGRPEGTHEVALAEMPDEEFRLHIFSIGPLQTSGILLESCCELARLSLKMSQAVRFREVLPSLLCVLGSHPWSAVLLESRRGAAVRLEGHSLLHLALGHDSDKEVTWALVQTETPMLMD